MSKEPLRHPKYLEYRILYIFVFLNCIWGTKKSWAQEKSWVIQSPYVTGGELIATDEKGYIYLTAFFEKDLQIDKQFLKEEKGRFFLVKYAPDYTLHWVLQLEYPVEDLLVQGEQIYLFGHFKNRFRIAETTLQGNEYFSAFAAKLNPEGHLLWLQKFSGEGDVLAKEMTVDPSGNVYFSGNFEETVVLGDTILHKNRKKNIYLAKYNNEGEFGWATQATGGLTAFTGVHVWGLAWDVTGHILLMGNLSGEAFFGNTRIVSSHQVFAGEGAVYNNDIFLARYAPEGKLLWVKNIAQNAEVQDMICSDNGSIYLTGYFAEPGLSSQVNFDGKIINAIREHPNQSPEATFVAKYSPLGNLIWVKRTASTQKNRGISIATDPKNKYVYVAGYFTENLSLQAYDTLFSANSSQNSDIFLLCLQANGKFIALEKAEGKENDFISDSCVDAQENWLLTGRFKKELFFRQLRLYSEYDKSNAFILNLNLKELK